MKYMYNEVDKDPLDSDLESESGMKLWIPGIWKPELDIRRLLD